MLLILMVLYHTIQNSGKMQHSLWVAEIIGSNHEDGGTSLTNADPIGVLPKRMSFRRIWQGKGAHKASSKVNFTYFDFPYSLFGIIEVCQLSWLLLVLHSYLIGRCKFTKIIG